VRSAPKRGPSTSTDRTPIEANLGEARPVEAKFGSYDQDSDRLIVIWLSAAVTGKSRASQRVRGVSRFVGSRANSALVSTTTHLICSCAVMMLTGSQRFTRLTMIVELDRALPKIVRFTGADWAGGFYFEESSSSEARKSTDRNV
jgi:hypothetical protein